MVTKRSTKGVKRGKRVKDLPAKASRAKKVRGGDSEMGFVARLFGDDRGAGSSRQNPVFLPKGVK